MESKVGRSAAKLKLVASMERLMEIPRSKSIADTEALIFMEEATEQRYDWTIGLRPQDVPGHEDWVEGDPLPAMDSNGNRLVWKREPAYVSSDRHARLEEVVVRVREAIDANAEGETTYVPAFQPVRFRLMVADLRRHVYEALDD